MTAVVLGLSLREGTDPEFTAFSKGERMMIDDSEDGQDIEGHVELVPVVLSLKGMGKAPFGTYHAPS